MTLTPEEVDEIKSQLREQVQHLPEQQKQSALLQIEQMSPQAVESLVEQQRQRNASPGPEKTIFRMIISGEVPSTNIDENDFALAVLDINPLSNGHILIIPKTAVKEEKDFPRMIIKLANKMAKRLSSKLKAKTVDIKTESKFGEVVLNVIPSYDSIITLQSPRSKALMEELESLAKKLSTKKTIQVIRIQKKTLKSNQVFHLPRRIP